MSIYMYQLRDLIRRSCRWILLLVKQKLQLWIHSPSPHKVIYQVFLSPVVFHFLDSFSGAFRYCSIVAHSDFTFVVCSPMTPAMQAKRTCIQKQSQRWFGLLPMFSYFHESWPYLSHTLMRRSERRCFISSSLPCSGTLIFCARPSRIFAAISLIVGLLQ